MKKSIIALAALAIVASACSKEETINSDYSFTASINTLTETKAQLGEGVPGGTDPTTGKTITTYATKFVAGDEVAVSNGTVTKKFATIENGTVARFTPSTTEDLTNFLSGNNFSLCYPYNSNCTATVSSVQTQVKDNASIGGIVLYATSHNLSGATIDFEVKSSLIKVVPKPESKVSKIVLTNGNNVITLNCDATNPYGSYLLGVNGGETVKEGAKIDVYVDGVSTPFTKVIYKSTESRTFTQGKIVTVNVPIN